MLMSEDYSAFSPSHNSMEWDACLEDLLDFADSDENSPILRPSNAVHMEIQNNAMLPTFNLNVDRANSSVVPRRSSAQGHSPTTRREIEEMMGLSQNELSLGEVFLKSKDRSSQKLNYYVPDTKKDALVNAANGEKDHSKTISSEAKESKSSDETQFMATQQLYYQRPQQLPIPKISPQIEGKHDQEVLKDAVAIAAAIAQQSPSLVGTPMNQDIVNTAIPTKELKVKNEIKSEASISKLKISNQISSRNGAIDSSNSHRYSRLHAIAPAPTPQIMSATMQRSQFGFGGNHSVPCVPQPPKRATSNRKKKGTESPPSSSSSLPLSTNSGPAYERKKQRAKDARMQLNDSIDRLSIAMSLAGTQSQQRAASIHVDFPDTRKSMEVCATTAASAKKWDRPSFVGTAADLIQCLNAQCESLERELKQMQQQQQQQAVVSPNHKRMEESNLEASDEISKKRRKLDALEENQNQALVFSNPKLLSIIASFADPLTLLRAQCLSKLFKACFSEESIWFQRCIQRFGISQVRHWNDKLLHENDLHDHEDDDNEDGFMGYFSSNHALSSCQLYRHLDEQNVSPIRCSDSCMESKPSMRCALLALSRMGHKLSAWVSLVERSNGETFRSVRQSNGQFKSLPVVELRLLVQNTGSIEPIQLHHQIMIVDASTRRRHEEWKEVVGDDRFTKRCLDIHGSPLSSNGPHLVQLGLFEAVTLVVFIHCRGCSTTSKFQQRANFTKVLVLINGTTVPLVIPFLRDKT